MAIKPIYDEVTSREVVRLMQYVGNMFSIKINEYNKENDMIKITITTRNPEVYTTVLESIRNGYI